MTVEEGNKLIADFLGWESYEDGVTYKFPNLYPSYNINDEENTGWISEQISEAKFHSSWDWLMPVVEKIEELNRGQFGFLISVDLVAIIDYMDGLETQVFRVDKYDTETKIEMTYDAVVQFIQWYNTQSK